MKAFFGKVAALFAGIWFVFQILTGARKVISLQREDPPVPLVTFRQSSRFLVLWPVILLTWVMSLLMYLHAGESPPEWLPDQVWLGGWWATILAFAVLIWRVRMRGPIAIAIVALILVFYFWMDRIGKWLPFLDFIANKPLISSNQVHWYSHSFFVRFIPDVFNPLNLLFLDQMGKLFNQG